MAIAAVVFIGCLMELVKKINKLPSDEQKKD